MQELILNFHGVGEPPAGTDQSELKYWWDVAPFYAMLDTVSVAIENPDRRIVLTFDDGNSSDARIALPALVRRNLKARFFPCAGRIGKPNYLDRSAIRDLVGAGMGVGSHGMNHVDWRQASADELEAEVSGARHALEEICGRPIDEVAIPFGSYNRRAIKKLREQGLRCVYTSDGGYARADEWLKARNSLDKTWQGKSLLKEFRGTSRFIMLLKQRYRYHKSMSEAV